MNAETPKVEAGQVWSTANHNSKFYIIAVMKDGTVAASSKKIEPGGSGMAMDYSPEVWASMVEHSGLMLDEDAV